MAIAMDSATTLDLLGGVSSSCTSSSELDIDSTGDLKLDFEMSAPRGWEKRLDLKAGRFYYVNLNTGKRSYNHPHNLLWNSELDSSELDLKLNLGSLASSRAPARAPRGNIVSTIEAVEEALKRSSSSSCSSRKRKAVDSTSSSTTSSTSSSSCSKLSSESQVVAEHQSSGGLFSKVVLSGCKRCLMYVMLTRSDPRCPKCGTAVVIDIPLEQLPKKPRLELSLL